MKARNNLYYYFYINFFIPLFHIVQTRNLKPAGVQCSYDQKMTIFVKYDEVKSATSLEGPSGRRLSPLSVA